MDSKTRVKWWRSGPPSTSPGEEVLKHVYVQEGLSLRQVAERHGVTSTTVARWLRAAGIQTRSVSEGTSLAQMGKPLSAAGKKASARNAAIARTFLTEESHRRRGENMRGRDAPNKGVPWTPEQRTRYMQTFSSPEYREAQAARQRGEKSHNWKGGISPHSTRHLARYEWRLRRLECYERDQWLCQDCGVKCMNTKDAKRVDPKRKIQAHHIVRRRDGGSDDLSNLTTLCMSCHHKREWRYHNALFA